MQIVNANSNDGGNEKDDNCTYNRNDRNSNDDNDKIIIMEVTIIMVIGRNSNNYESVKCLCFRAVI